MKLSSLIVLVAVFATGCAQYPAQQVQTQQTYPQQYVRQSAHPYAMQQQAAQPVVARPPSWFTNLPQDTPDMIFAVGVAQSSDEQMAYDKARLTAERKLVEMMGSRVKSSSKSTRIDNNGDMIENTEIAVRRTAEGDLAGAQRVDSQATFDGKRYKVYVLMRYPLADNNPLRKEREMRQTRREAELRAVKAQQDLDDQSQQRLEEAERNDQRLKREIGIRETARADKPLPITIVQQPQ